MVPTIAGVLVVLSGLASGGGASESFVSEGEPRSCSSRPSVLFLLADDQRRDSLSCEGNRSIATPNLDSLAASGTRFSRAYCMGSIHGAVCQPSRAMLWSGRSLYRVPMNLADVPTVPEVLRSAGYRTFGTGKWHNGEASFARSFAEGRSVFMGGMSDHDQVPVKDLANGEYSAARTAPRFSTEEFTEAALEFLDGQDGSEPFFCMVSYTVPHDPRTPPPEFRERDSRPPLPRNYLPQHPFHNGWMVGRDEILLPWPRPRELVREQISEYYGLIEHLDRAVGRLLDKLDERGLAENTLVVYTADHGLAMGSHGLLGKQNVYEHSMGAPMILRGPGVPRGQQLDALVYLHDLAPTLLHAASVPAPEGVEGIDLGPLLRGECSALRGSLYLTYENCQRALVTPRFKYIWYPRIAHQQLFDLTDDPHETHSLIHDAEHQSRITELRRALEQWHARTDDPHPLVVAEPEPMAIDLTGRKRSPDRHQPHWVVEKYFDGPRTGGN